MRRVHLHPCIIASSAGSRSAPGKENIMKTTRVRIWYVFLLIGMVNFLVLACSLGTVSSRTIPTMSANITKPNSNGSGLPTALQKTVISTNLPAPSMTATIMDLAAAGLPPGFPLYPGGHDFSGIQGMMVEYTVDADVRTASDFYAAQMAAGGYSDLLGGGGMTGECGGDCGPVPTHTPGPTPTSTPEGWMRSTDQVWMQGSKQISINYLANPDGTTDISIVFIGN
jgi:hypothetical protein